ncbi:MAG: hypothetical protein ACXVHK_31285 [Solirubrobacteraceae bacterium]
MLSIIQIMDVVPLGGYLGAQPPKLSFLLTVVFAHAVRYTRRGKGLASSRHRLAARAPLSMPLACRAGGLLNVRRVGLLPRPGP